jgi:hypothetical protein
MFSPGEGFPSETTSPSSSSTATPLALPSSHSTFPPGGIAGIVLGGVVAIAIIGWFCFIRRRKKHNGSQTPSTSYVPSTRVTQSSCPPPDYPQSFSSPQSPSNARESSTASYPEIDSTNNRSLSPLISPDPTGRFPFDVPSHPISQG